MAKILVIEDVPSNRDLVSVVLEYAGHSVCTAQTAEEGIEIARISKPDAIVMDIRLPGMDGLAATRVIKTDPQLKNIKILALTAAAMAGDRERILSAGCDAYIQKPLRYRNFLTVLCSLLGFPSCV
jgi:two-component system cell cycle response regulator DivK